MHNVIIRVALAACLLFLLASCSTKGPKRPPVRSKAEIAKLIKERKSAKKYMGHYKVGKPYSIKNSKYYPKKYDHYESTGIASWYGERNGFHGNTTANGDTYDKDVLTAAHKTLPLPSIVKVTNLSNNRSIIVMVNDRGPYSGNRLIDVSERGAEILGFKNKGTTKVKVTLLKEESKKLLKKLALQDVEGSKPAGMMEQAHCSLDCYIDQVNLSHNLDHVLLADNKEALHIKHKTIKPKHPELASSHEGEKYFVITDNLVNQKNAHSVFNKLKHLADVKLAKNGNKYAVKVGPVYNKVQAMKISVQVEKLSGISSRLIQQGV